MPLQRVRDAENRVRNKLSNGPRRVQSNVNLMLSHSYLLQIRRVFCNVKAYVSCLGYRGILIRAQVYSCECKVAPRMVISTFVLDRKRSFCQGLFILCNKPLKIPLDKSPDRAIQRTENR